MHGSSEPRVLDTLLTGALVVDGTGAEPFVGDIGIAGDTTAVVSPAGVETPVAVEVVDCAGLVLTPGFVDVHTHSDVSFLLDPSANSKDRKSVV